MHARAFVLVSVLWAAPALGQPAAPSGGDAPLAPLLTNLGSLRHAVTTTSGRAQVFFDQGLRLVYAFNHNEAIRAFREAARLDPDCAMAYWGQALALGPNLNDPMTPEREAEAHQVLQKALALKDRVTPAERGLIEALAARYPAPPADRAQADAAFARAMGALAAKFPDDPEVTTLYAAALMETRPWDYWNADGSPKEGVATAVKTLEDTIQKHPAHPGAHHFYIHLVEATDDPDRAVPSADVLESLMPGAGHLVHMPAHIYVRVGRYADASASNERAILADEDYIAQCQAQGLYPIGYYPHNIHFLWSAATFEGRSEKAIDSARKVAAKMHHDVVKDFVMLQDFQATPYYALVRFGRWEEMLTEGQPPPDLAFTTAMWHYGRAAAFTARGQLDRADAELTALRVFESHPSLKDQELATTPLPSLVALAAKVVEGELAAKRKRWDEAVRLLTDAVALQDAQRYNEPPTWHYPVRHALGAVLLDAGRAAEAEAVYREDLRRNRENGWALAGLARSLEAQGKTADAAAVDARFRRAWSRADVALASSRF